MIMLVLVLALNSAQVAGSSSAAVPPLRPDAGGAVDWCDSVYTVALATARGQAAGMSRQEAETAVAQLPSSEARIAGARVVMMAYGVNAAGRVSPEQFAELVRSGCLQAEPDNEAPEQPSAPASAASAASASSAASH